MTTKIITGNVFLALALALLLSAQFVSAAEVTGTLTAGAIADPGSGTISGSVSGGSGGSISGTVSGGGGGSISGTVSSGGGGGSSGSRGGGGNSPAGEVLGASDSLSPSFPNAGFEPEDSAPLKSMGVLIGSLALLLSTALVREKRHRR